MWASGNCVPELGLVNCVVLLLVCVCFVFVSLIQLRVILEEGASAENIPPLDWSVGKSMGGIFPIKS